MIQFALNHMTVAPLSFRDTVALARDLGCVGVELRNDLGRPLFDGMAPADAGAFVRDAGLRFLALAEVKRFNDWGPETETAARALMGIAVASGAEAVALIPRNDNLGMGNGERQAALRVALRALAPMLRDHGLTGLVEPLGFVTCPVRDKSETVDAIEATGGADVLRLVHDTFHHTLAGGGALHPAATGIVHVSGVRDRALATAQMEDRHRVLVDEDDRLGTVAQIARLLEQGWSGPVSFECFAPEVRNAPDPRGRIGASMEFIREGLARRAA